MTTMMRRGDILLLMVILVLVVVVVVVVVLLLLPQLFIQSKGIRLHLLLLGTCLLLPFMTCVH